LYEPRPQTERTATANRTNGDRKPHEPEPDRSVNLFLGSIVYFYSQYSNETFYMKVLEYKKYFTPIHMLRNLINGFRICSNFSSKMQYTECLAKCISKCTTVLFCSVPFRSVPFHSVPFRSVPFLSFPFLSFPSRPVPSRSVPFRSVPFRSVLFCSVLFCSVLFCSVLFCSVLFCSILVCLFNVLRASNPC
jgi:hypothetical protein